MIPLDRMDPSFKVLMKGDEQTKTNKKETGEQKKAGEIVKETLRAQETPETKSIKQSVRQRASSTPSKPLSAEAVRQAAEIEEISKKSGVLWECVAWKRDEFGGHILKFKLKDEYDDVTNPGSKERAEASFQKYREIYPAIELPGQGVQAEMFAHGDLQQLGYNCAVVQEGENKGVYMYLPDKESFEARWEKLREKRPELPPFTILNSKGISSDIEFFEGNITHDAVLSDGLEFMHDHIGHIIPIALSKIELESDNRTEIAKIMLKAYRRVIIGERITEDKLKDSGLNKKDLEEESISIRDNIEKMKTALGGLADALSSVAGFVPNEEYIDQHFQEMWDNPENEFLKRRFGEIDSTELSSFWKLMKEIELEFDKTYKRWEKTSS